MYMLKFFLGHLCTKVRPYIHTTAAFSGVFTALRLAGTVFFFLPLQPITDRRQSFFIN